MPSVLRAASLNFFPTIPNISLRLFVAPAAIHPQIQSDQTTRKAAKTDDQKDQSSEEHETTGRSSLLAGGLGDGAEST